MHVIYQDKKEGEDVFVNLFFTLGADNVFYVIETVIPQDSKPIAEEQLEIMVDSWNVVI